MAPTPTTRRRALATLGVVGIAALGAGFGRVVPLPAPAGDGSGGDAPDGAPDLRLDYQVDVDDDPTSAPNDTSFPWTVPSLAGIQGNDDEEWTPTPTDGDGRHDDGRESDDGDDGGDGTPVGGGSGGGSGGGPPTTSDAAPTTVVETPPLDLHDVLPGDSGTVTATLTLADASAALWLSARATDAEGDLTEPERAAGDDTPDEGELGDVVRATLWVDVDGDGGDPAPDEVVYEGPLSGLDSLSAGISLGPCLEPGEYVVRLRWSVPASATNALQDDSTSFGFAFAATACGGRNPFA